MHAFVTGGAGFIGSSLVDRLLSDGHNVTAFDNFSTGLHRFLAGAVSNPRFTLIKGDTLDLDALTRAMNGCDVVFHLAANADVRFGTDHPKKDFEQNTIATFNVLEAMRTNRIRRIAFSSTGSVYGEAAIFPTPEDAPFPVQTSLYGASKLAGEGLIAAYGSGFGFEGCIFRFVSILGERYTHGHVFDFYKSLRMDPTRLRVLGNGKQRKSYLYIGDCLDAMLLAMSKARGAIEVFNLGTNEYCEVNDSIGWICERLGVSPVREYTGGDRGWIGDNPFIFLDTAKIRSLEWQPKLTIRDGIIRTLEYLRANPEILEDARMKVAVLGLWHLGSVTAACAAAAGHHVIGWDRDADTIGALHAGRAPIAEPGLDALVASGLMSGLLRFTGDAREAVGDAEVVWITFDTPVDDEDRADVDDVMRQVAAAFPHLKDGAVVLSSSQLPVGSVARLERGFAETCGGRRVSFACSPENLRLGKAIDAFTHPDRVIIGVRNDDAKAVLTALFQPIADHLEWMSVESAEMTKHAINAFLATSVTFINEIAALCEQAGADAKEVERGLKTEKRIGPYAYLGPGTAFAGGTLARDVVFLRELGRAVSRPTPLIEGVDVSNREHRNWARRRLESALSPLSGKTVAVWGLTYKPGTDTLRRSTAVELCRWLVQQSVRVRAHDPAARALPDDLGSVTRTGSPEDAATGADALVVATEWPDYRSIDLDVLATVMSGRVVIDGNRFLGNTIGRDARFRLVSVGAAGS